MGEFGESLRRERETRGISLDDISAATKISVRLLQAIEDEEFERLPGGVFNVNFVRQYARHLGLDEEKIMGEFRELTTPVIEPDIASPGPIPEWVAAGRSDYEWDRERQSRVWTMATSLLVAVGVAAGLYLWLSRRTVSPPGSVVSGSPSPPQPAPASPHEPGQAPALEPKPAATPPPEATPAGAPRPAEPPAEAPGTVSSGGATPARRGAPAAVQVGIQTTDVVWVSASADGQVVLERILQPQETRLITARSLVSLRVGDTAAVTLTLNGVVQPPIGGKGHVRTIVFTPNLMQVLPPIPKAETQQPQPNQPQPARTQAPAQPDR